MLGIKEKYFCYKYKKIIHTNMLYMYFCCDNTFEKSIYVQRNTFEQSIYVQRNLSNLTPEYIVFQHFKIFSKEYYKINIYENSNFV